MNYAKLKFTIKTTGRKILKSTIVIKCLSVVISLYAIFAGKTTKWKIKGVDEFIKNTKSSNVILVGWHSRATMLPYFWNKYINARLSALVSPHQDGQIMAHFLKRFKINAVNGSSNEKGRQGALELMRELMNGSNLFISPDGPRGPRMRMKKSPIYFAQKSGKPIYCVCFSSNKALIFEKAWDKTMILLPFGKGVFQISEPIYIPQNLSDEEFEQYRQKVENIAINLSINCDKEVGRIPCQPADMDDYKRKENE
ncbi:MAG: DUF374 domain-containing protein [Alphaproteobacteria bacterium]|nr:DUF374 domain-containing protein [Alphaproteobacteria bacterium]